MMQPVIITAALVGGELTREDTPHLPLTPEEIGREAAAVVQVGASIIHLHARDHKGVPRHDPKVFQLIQTEIRNHCRKAGVEEPIQQFSTGGSVGMTLAERMAPLDLKPEMASLNMGTMNFGEDIFENKPATIQEIARRLMKDSTAIELEIMDAGMMDYALTLIAKNTLKPPYHFNFVLGVAGGMAGDPENLMFLLPKVPVGATWGVAGMGRYQLPLSILALVLGGHVRLGLEDNIYYRKGERVKGNVPLVERVVRMAKELDRPVATPAEAREILGMKR